MTLDPSESYLREILEWFEQLYERWRTSVGWATDFDHATPVHWGGTAALRDIVIMVTSHWLYHEGEINAILAIGLGEAWEYGEEVEENDLSTIGHRGPSAVDDR